jgi:hypothetical protein
MLGTGASAGQLFSYVFARCLNQSGSGTWIMDHADREETILWLVQKGGISPGV